MCVRACACLRHLIHCTFISRFLTRVPCGVMSSSGMEVVFVICLLQTDRWTDTPPDTHARARSLARCDKCGVCRMMLLRPHIC